MNWNTSSQMTMERRLHNGNFSLCWKFNCLLLQVEYTHWFSFYCRNFILIHFLYLSGHAPNWKQRTPESVVLTLYSSELTRGTVLAHNEIWNSSLCWRCRSVASTCVASSPSLCGIPSCSGDTSWSFYWDEHFRMTDVRFFPWLNESHEINIMFAVPEITFLVCSVT